MERETRKWEERHGRALHSYLARAFNIASVRGIARAIDVSDGHLSAIFRGKAPLTRSMLLRISAAVGKAPHEILQAVDYLDPELLPPSACAAAALDHELRNDLARSDKGVASPGPEQCPSPPEEALRDAACSKILAVEEAALPVFRQVLAAFLYLSSPSLEPYMLRTLIDRWGDKKSLVDYARSTQNLHVVLHALAFFGSPLEYVLEGGLLKVDGTLSYASLPRSFRDSLERHAGAGQ